MKVLEEVRKDLTEAENTDLDRFIKKVVAEYVAAECKFLDLVYEMGDQEDLTIEQSKDFIEYLGELRLFQMDLISLEDVRDNPLEWMDYILSGSTHTNFFENRVVDYSHNGLAGEVDYGKHMVEPEATYTIIGRKGCPYCVKAKELLTSEGISFIYKDKDEDEEAQRQFEAEGHSKVPQIYRRGKPIGGFTELEVLF